jgi:hypothetical protein
MSGCRLKHKANIVLNPTGLKPEANGKAARSITMDDFSFDWREKGPYQPTCIIFTTWQDLNIEGCKILYTDNKWKTNVWMDYLSPNDIIKGFYSQYETIAIPYKIETEVITHSQFHMIWTEAVGKDGYNKDLFRNLYIELYDKCKLII